MSTEYQKPFSGTARENFEKAFCPYRHDMGDHFNITGECFKCKENNSVSYLSCEDKYKEYCSRGERSTK